MTRLASGFTLIEVLVALGIVAVTLVAGLRSTMALSDTAQRQSDGVVAQLCAENALVGLRLTRQIPAVGTSDFPCDMGGRVFQGALVVSATPNPIFRRVDAQVRDGQYVVFRIAAIFGSFQ